MRENRITTIVYDRLQRRDNEITTFLCDSYFIYRAKKTSHLKKKKKKKKIIRNINYPMSQVTFIFLISTLIIS